jgi:hypothetical protein
MLHLYDKLIDHPFFSVHDCVSLTNQHNHVQIDLVNCYSTISPTKDINRIEKPHRQAPQVIAK